jgi:hypothetical protein
LIISKLLPAQDGSRYVITQGAIAWNDDNWYMNPANALWIQLVLMGAKDWLKCRNGLKLDKNTYNFQFMNTLSNLVRNIDYGFNSEIKIVSSKVSNPLQSRSNKTAVKLLSCTLSEIVDSISVPHHFFDNSDRGTFVQFIFRENEKVKHSHMMQLAKMKLSSNTENILLMLRTECDASEFASQKLLVEMKKKALRT